MSILDGVGVGVKRKEGQEYEALDPEMLEQCPSVYEFLARLEHQGSRRDLASLTIKYSGGGVNLCLSCPSEGVVGFQQGKTLKDAINGLERRLAAQTMDWRERKSGEWRKSK